MSGKKSFAKSIFSDRVSMIVLLLPFITFFILFTVLPILTSVALSFTSYDMIAFPKVIGLENYRRMIVDDSAFIVTVRNTFIFSVVAGPLGFLLSFVLASMTFIPIRSCKR